MAKISIIRNASVKDKEGRSPINLRLVDRGTMKSISTGFSAAESEWDKESHLFIAGKGFNKVLRREEGRNVEYTRSEANAILGDLARKGKRILERWEEDKVNWTLTMFEDEFKKKRVDTIFLEYAYKRINAYGKGSNTSAILVDTLRDLELFEHTKHKKGLKKDIKDISRAYLDEYRRFCENRGLSTNTISIRLRSIRAVLYHARDIDNIEIASPCPFGEGGLKIKSEAYTKTANYIPKSLLMKIAETPISDNPRLEEARHLFLFSVYAAGMNFADMGKLTKKNIDWVTIDGKQQEVIVYARSKTDEKITVYVYDYLKKELDWFRNNSNLVGQYLLPIIQGQEPDPEKRTAYINGRRHRFDKQLKKIAVILDFPEALRKIGSYTARHTYAMSLRSDGVADALISANLGHKDQRTTKHYFAQFGDAEKREAGRLFK